MLLLTDVAHVLVQVALDEEFVQSLDRRVDRVLWSRHLESIMRNYRIQDSIRIL